MVNVNLHQNNISVAEIIISALTLKEFQDSKIKLLGGLVWNFHHCGFKIMLQSVTILRFVILNECNLNL